MDPLELEKGFNEEILAISNYPEIITGNENVAYASSATSTGKRLVRAFGKYGVRSKDELKEKHPGTYEQEVWNPNVEDAKRFAERLRSRHKYVLNASEFHIIGWEQEHYNALWEQVIRKKNFNPIYFNDEHDNEYHYSEGSVRELLWGIMWQKDTLDEDGSRLVWGDEAEKIWEAIQDYEKVGVKPANLINLHREIWLYIKGKQPNSAIIL
jgi:hypothetical protein